MSIQFNPPKGLTVAHLGAFWELQREQLPIVRAAEPIIRSAETFGEPKQWVPPESIQLSFSTIPDCRLQLLSLDDEWMYQLQRDRLIVNWRKRKGDYPHLGATWTRFAAVLDDFQGFLNKHDLPPVAPNFWELVYVNRIVRNTIWQTPADWPQVLPGLWATFLRIDEGAIHGFHGEWVWEFPKKAAKLYVTARPMRVPDAALDVLTVSLTARGRLNSADTAEVQAGLEDGRAIVFSAFEAITSNDAKKAWGRQNAT